MAADEIVVDDEVAVGDAAAVGVDLPENGDIEVEPAVIALVHHSRQSPPSAPQ